MGIDLDKHQIDAINQLDSGKILCGGVGSGKTRASLAYYYLKECGANLKINGVGEYSPMKKKMDLYVVTTAKKRDSFDWESEAAAFILSTDRSCSIDGVQVTVDSWNNLHKYIDIQNSFFIFDEQRVVGKGEWVKSFIKVCKNNRWILLTATPGDTWMDYVPVFVANGFYKNRTEFIRSHVVYNSFTKFPKIDRYVGEHKLSRLRDNLLVIMDYVKFTVSKNIIVPVLYNAERYSKVMYDRWNVFEDRPIRDIGELCYALRKVVNEDASRFQALEEIINKHHKIVVFYNFDHELELLRDFIKIPQAEWNGHKHQPIPLDKNEWAYLVQYNAGAEGWNCIDTDTIVFFSQNYSNKIMTQSAGRIDRRNTKFKDLYYYTFISEAPIDKAIRKALDNKKNFHEQSFIKDI